MEKQIIGRKSQINTLKDALTSSKPEMVALIGRRRVGKTFLIRQVYQNRIDFELTGLQDGNTKAQLQNFQITFSKYFSALELNEKPQNWLAAFHQLSLALDKLSKSEKMVVFIDELPWLDASKSDFIMALGWFWNSWASQKNIVLAICGSSASWMIKKIINDRGGLHNRVTKLVMLYPFTLSETEEYFRYRNINMNRTLILQIYMVMGGIPMYLDQLKSGLSAMQNIQEICFERDGYLKNEFERLLASLFKNYHHHVNIIRALATKNMGLTRSEIISLTKYSNGGMLTEILDELEKSGFISIQNSLGKRLKDSIYRLSDPYSLFYLTFIEPLGKNLVVEFNSMSDLPAWKTWCGYAFENVCFYHLKAIKKALGIAGVSTRTGSFYAKATDEISGAQIDLIIDRNDQVMNLCEVKYSINEYTVTKKDVENLERKKGVFRYYSKTKKHIFTSLITTNGVVNNTQKINYIDHVVVLDDLFIE